MSRTNKDKKKKLNKAKATKPTIRITQPPNKVFKSKKQYKRNKKVKAEDYE